MPAFTVGISLFILAVFIGLLGIALQFIAKRELRKIKRAK